MKVFWVFDPLTGMRMFDSQEARDALVAQYARKGVSLQHVGSSVVAGNIPYSVTTECDTCAAVGGYCGH